MEDNINHCCGHDHHHDHSCSIENHVDSNVIYSDIHEGAVVCSFEKDFTWEINNKEKEIVKILNDFRKILDENDCLIGHIKMFIKETKELGFSTTGAEIDINTDDTELKVYFAAIVFNIDKEELEKLVYKNVFLKIS